MKSIWFGIAFALLVTHTAFAQRDDGTSMGSIIERANAVVERLEKKNYEVVRIEMDIVAGEKETQRYLSSDWTYGAIAIADDRVEDLDIYVFKEVDGEWVQVKKDDTDDAIPAVALQPKETSLYKFVIKAHKYADGYSAAHYALMIYHE
jgi:hypothetical protein